MSAWPSVGSQVTLPGQAEVGSGSSNDNIPFVVVAQAGKPGEVMSGIFPEFSGGAMGSTERMAEERQK